MSDETCMMEDPWHVVFPCDTPEPCSVDGETTLWTMADCAAMGAPTWADWCQAYTHPTCPVPVVEVEAPTPVADTLPATGGGSLMLAAALLCAAGWACLKTTKGPPPG